MEWQAATKVNEFSIFAFSCSVLMVEIVEFLEISTITVKRHTRDQTQKNKAVAMTAHGIILPHHLFLAVHGEDDRDEVLRPEGCARHGARWTLRRLQAKGRGKRERANRMSKQAAFRVTNDNRKRVMVCLSVNPKIWSIEIWCTHVVFQYGSSANIEAITLRIMCKQFCCYCFEWFSGCKKR